MPVYLRKFYLNKLIEAKNEEQKEIDKANKQSKNVQRPNIKR